jgi:hypothetical protein
MFHEMCKCLTWFSILVSRINCKNIIPIQSIELSNIIAFNISIDFLIIFPLALVYSKFMIVRYFGYSKQYQITIKMATLVIFLTSCSYNTIFIKTHVGTKIWLLFEQEMCIREEVAELSRNVDL